METSQTYTSGSGLVLAGRLPHREEDLAVDQAGRGGAARAEGHKEGEEEDVEVVHEAGLAFVLCYGSFKYSFQDDSIFGVMGLGVVLLDNKRVW
ncbi:hypothetical protein ColTof4_05515 [Colletotrichum tofieldiae]|nr:hypothetical protein ColTof3_00672 [Colletotrichum tofieldiae]GKT73092.1 hypothetical protein ColTof4_05515 [Colletotrichum tofieldiae]GKT88244.1 hypothetical protein Ct61P_06094 [Colletotrichum tofieldiae]